VFPKIQVLFDPELERLVPEITDLESDYDGTGSEDEIDNEEEAEVCDNAALLHFAATLQQAHYKAMTLEYQNDLKRCQPKQYTGNSVQTKQNRDMSNIGQNLQRIVNTGLLLTSFAWKNLL
jgi:hypothetical protein